MTFRKFIGTIHLWLGLTVGLVVFVVAITGCLYAFKTEIEEVTQPYRFTVQQSQPVLPPSRLLSIAKQAMPGKLAHAVLYPGSGRSANVIFYKENPGGYYDIVYLDPYTGSVLSVDDQYSGFFPFVLDGHFYLWLPHEIGQPVVATATLIFFVMVVSGIILWWPRNKAGRKQRFSIRWSARWRRRNYDLHNVLGFYSCVVALAFIITGLVWGFEWFSKSYYYTISGGGVMRPYAAPVSAGTSDDPQNPVDAVWVKMVAAYPPGAAIEVHPPEEANSCIAANANPSPGTYWKIDYRYFDQKTLNEIPVDHIWGRFASATRSELLMRMNYDIHVGAIWGLPGKILAFSASLIIASLPVTGFLIWLGRRRKIKSHAPSITKHRRRAMPEPAMMER